MASEEASRYRKFLRLLRAFAADPSGVSRALPGLIEQRRGLGRHREVDEAWEVHLRTLLGAPLAVSRAYPSR